MSTFRDFFKIESGDFARPSVVVLILANLVPLLGVIFLDWQVFSILLIFWLENVIIGIFNVLKMAIAQGGESKSPGTKVSLIPFFCLHYGVFTLVHGMFIFVLFGGILGGNGFAGSNDDMLFDPWQSIWAALGLLISHTVSFVMNYIRKGEYRNTTTSRLMFQPYGRVVVMHLTIMAGAFLLVFLGTPLAGLIILVVLKITLDIAAHLRQHKQNQAPAGLSDWLSN